MEITMHIKLTVYATGEKKIIFETIESDNIPMVGDIVSYGGYGRLTVMERIYFFGNLKGLIQKGGDSVTLILERK